MSDTVTIMMKSELEEQILEWSCVYDCAPTKVKDGKNRHGPSISSAEQVQTATQGRFRNYITINSQPCFFSAKTTQLEELSYLEEICSAYQ